MSRAKLKFLDNMFSDVMMSPERKRMEREYNRAQNKYRARCKRLMKKHNITMTRDLSYWDFSAPVGTCGMNEGVDGWPNAYHWLCGRLVEVGLENVNHAEEKP